MLRYLVDSIHHHHGLVSDHHARSFCHGKNMCYSYGDEVLIVQGDRSSEGNKSKLSIISCTKTQKYIKKGCPTFLAQVTKKETEDKSEEKRLEDVSIARDFPKVFPEDLPGLPSTRQLQELSDKIDLRFGYHQLKVQEEDILKTAFGTRYGQYEFQVMPFELNNTLTLFMDLMNRVCKPYLDKFMIVFIDDILIYSKNKKEHEKHLKLISRLLKKEELYTKFSKCEFWLSNVQFLGHVIDSEGIHMDPTKIESIKVWASPKTPTEIRTNSLSSFAFAGYYPTIYRSAPILALPEGSENFVVYCDASHKGLGAVLMQREKVIAYVVCNIFLIRRVKHETTSMVRTVEWLRLRDSLSSDWKRTSVADVAKK
ncbi:putative reverse transcriptase domain-containing protein [Tanacetum coccineum]